MNLKELVEHCLPSAVLDEVVNLYPDQAKNIEGYFNIIAELLDLEPDFEGAGTMRIEVYHVIQEWDFCDDDDYIGVHGIDPNAVLDEFTGMKGEDIGWAIEYTPWEEWLAMEVTCTCPTDERTDTPEKLLAHILFEMSWAGFTQKEVQNQKDEIMRRKDEVDEAIENGTIDEITTPCSDVFKDLGIEPPDNLEEI